jgi:phenylalanyl-tRNA synthetase beta chain
VVPIQNPLREEQGILRPLLLASLIDALDTNYKRKQTRLGLFELGTVFGPSSSGDLPEERLHLGFVACGEVDRGWQELPQARDFFYAKGIVEKLLDALGTSGAAWERATDNPMLHPGRSANILVDGVSVGVVGELHPSVSQNYEIPNRVVACEIDLISLLPMVKLDARSQTLPRYPGSNRDLAIVVSLETPAGCIREIIISAGGELLWECRLFDVYQGSQVPEGSRSLAYSLLFQSLERTLTDEEVTVVYSRILSALSSQVGARLR